ncbi:MAG: hypothetical protein HYS32_00040 [Candidatus Woesearchaeota archaeon]|nr:MAG: hypothetical protein HYS32_00040 [Candidatus Woesearchaeota archaeon]
MKKAAVLGLNALHLLIILTFFVLFFFNATVHFIYALVLLLNQFIMGILLWWHIKKFKLVCALTALTKKIEGHKLTDKENYNTTFLHNVTKRFINIKPLYLDITGWFCIFLVFLRYFWV